MQGFDFDGLIFRFRYPLLVLLLGLIVLAGGILFFKNGFSTGAKVEILEGKIASQSAEKITVESAGEVIKPGVYKVDADARSDDLLVISGGFSGNADRSWTDKYLNRAAKLTDGQKVYVPKIGQQSETLGAKTGGGDQTISSQNSSDSNNQININTASLAELDRLPGIGQIYGQSIIDHRPYSNVEELLSKGALKQSVYNKVRDLVTVY